jgi:sugar phosphate isomerase/epimerase
VKCDTLFKMDADEIDYSFELVKALGARAMSSEISFDDAEMKRMGQFAAKHRVMVGYHGHTKVTPAMWEKAFTYSKYNGANVDLGHFIAGNNYSPVPFLKQYHDRVTHVHIKDRKLHEGPNTEMGKGDTPIVEVLHLIRDQKWNIDAILEFEYPVPAGSTRMAEIAKMAQYCRDALIS